MTERVAFIGLGSMGQVVAAHLLADGHALAVYNRTPDRAAALVASGARLASSPADAVEPGGIVFTMVADDAALEAVTLGPTGILSRLGDGIHVSMSTVSTAAATRLAEAHQRVNAAFVSATVFGRPEDAASRLLRICLAGPLAAKEQVLPLLAPLAQQVIDFGVDPAAANVVKLAGNFLLMSAIEAIAEACLLVDRSGVDPAAFIRVLPFIQSAYPRFGQAVAEQRHTPAAFRLALGLKDATLIRDAAMLAGVPMPLADLVRSRFVASVAKGRGELNWTALALAVAEDAGEG